MTLEKVFIDRKLKQATFSFDSIQSVEHYIPEDQKTTIVEWTLGNTCNFSCSYCPDILHDGSIPWIKFDDIKRFLDRLKHHYQDRLGQKVWMQYTGGEPTLYPSFLELVEHASDNGFKQSIITNGSKPLHFWRKVRSKIDFTLLTFHNETNYKDHFEEVIATLIEGCPVHVNFTMGIENFDDTIQFAKKLRERFDSISMTLKPLRVNFGKDLYPYNEEQTKLLKMRLPPKVRSQSYCRGVMNLVDSSGNKLDFKANELIVENLNQWTGWNCSVGKEFLVIKADGAIYRGMCRAGGKVGNIDDKEINLPSEDITCEKDRCRCVTDILTTKHRIIENFCHD